MEVNSTQRRHKCILQSECTVYTVHCANPFPFKSLSYPDPDSLFMFSGPSSPVPLNTTGHGFRMYRPSKNPSGQKAQKTPHLETVLRTDINSSRGLIRLRQPRGLGDGWPSPMGAEGGDRISGGSNSWTRAPLHTMEALIVTTPAMSGNGSHPKSD